MSRFSRTDLLLLLMILIWGTNYSIVKHAFRELDPQAFNAGRMTIASIVFLALILVVRRVGSRSDPAGPNTGIFYTPSPITPSDWLWLAGLGVVGHAIYQYFFIGGLARTSVANSSLLLGATPVVIAVSSAALGQERITRLHWVGALLSVAGIVAVVGAGAELGGAHLAGDLMMLVAVACWAIYTMASRHLMARHSPVGVTGLSMIVGSVLYLVLVNGRVRAAEWSSLSGGTWLALVYSALFALCVAYTIWYVGVREIGSARTSIYSNLIPIVAMLTAVLFLGESIGVTKIIGASAVIAGVALTRIGRTQVVMPAEE